MVLMLLALPSTPMPWPAWFTAGVPGALGEHLHEAVHELHGDALLVLELLDLVQLGGVLGLFLLELCDLLAGPFVLLELDLLLGDLLIGERVVLHEQPGRRRRRAVRTNSARMAM